MPLRRFLTLAALVTLATTAMAQRRPAVESFEPSFGPPAGGTRVTIRGKNLYPLAPPSRAPEPQCTPCPPANPEVLFGGKLAEIESYTDEMIVVKTPPNAGGVYDVQIGSFYHAPVVLLRAFQYGGNSAERVLVPVLADRVPGAFGSIWTTELVGRNEINGTTIRPTLQHNGAAFLYADEGEVFNLRVRDLSRQADSWGTEVPLVRVNDAFVNERISIVNVPFDPESRITLRVYDLDGETGGEVPVSIKHDEFEILLAETRIHFPAGEYLDRPAVPAHVTIDVNALLPHMTSPPSRLRIQVGEPFSFPQKRLWAMVSVTDLETQMVTIVTPQRAKRRQSLF